MDRFYSRLTVKSVDDDKRVLTGIASTPSTDRVGDIVEPKGAEFKLPIPFLWQHDSKQPIGHVTKAKVTKDGIEVEVRLVQITEPGILKDRLDEAWQSIKAGLVRGLSIGFSPVESARIDGTYGMRFLKWLWLELSAVTIAANADASIQTIKSLDLAQLAATGQSGSTPGASGTAASRGSSTNRSPKGTVMQTISQLREDRNTKANRAQELTELRKSESRRFTDDERTEFDALSDEIEDLDDEIRVKNFHNVNSASASAVDGSSLKSGSASRGGMSFVRRADPEDKFKGQSYVRGVIARAMAELTGGSPGAIAEYRWGKTNPHLVQWIKANEVAGGGTGSGEWGSELVAMDGLFSGAFIEFLYGATVFDKLPFTEIPANVTVKGQDAEGTAYWVGESKAIPPTTASFSTVNLSPLKVAALAVVSNDLIRYSSPAAEERVANMLRKASAKRIDQTVFSADAASAAVSPAGLLNGVTAIVTTGTDEAAVRALVSALYAPFITATNSSDLWWVSGPAQAKAISLLVNSLGQTSFPTVNGKGGLLLGDNLVVGDYIDGSQIILLKPADIFKIGDTGFEVSVSREAMIEQNSIPTGATDTPVAASATMTSMFQEDSTAIKIVRHINFAKARSDAVAFTNTADFQGTAS